MDAPEPSPELLAEVHGDLRALSVARMIRLAVVATVALGIAAAIGLRHDNPASLGAIRLAVVAGYAVSGLVLFSLAFGLPVPLGRRLRWTVAAALVGAVAMVSAAVVSVPDAHPFMVGSACLGTGVGLALGFSLGAMVTGRGVLRRHAPTGWLLGVGAGMLSLVMLQLGCVVCPTSYGMSALWHGLVPLVAGGLTAAVWRLAPPTS